MKLADHPSTTVEVPVRADRADLWTLITDITLPTRFSRELIGAHWLDEPGPGARFIGISEHPRIGQWEILNHVVIWEPLQAFGWATVDPDRPGASWTFEVEPTVLRYHARLGSGPSKLAQAISRYPEQEELIIERRLGEWRDNMQAVVNGIKDLVEGVA
ncbi:SRPBCC family protein [Pseudonocardiaceae bacterium YIM PH 21723]|nr:SRPBCC family protein [Pseudonocardiaceae bacterium YIM PH 21723]